MSPALPRVVVAGGGVAALEAALALLDRGSALAIELVAAENRFTNRPLSVLEPFAAGGARAVPLSRLAQRGVEVVQGRVTGVAGESRRLLTADSGDRPYDALLLALGAHAVPPFEHALTFPGPCDSGPMHELVEHVSDGAVGRVAFVAPRGLTWPLPLYELALQTAGRAARAGAGTGIVLVTAEERPLSVFGRTGAALMECLLEEAGIEVICAADPDVPAPGLVRTGTGTELEADRVVAMPRLEGLALTGVPTDSTGFIPTGAHGQVLGLGRVWAAGDGADGPIKQGGIAAQQADRAVDAMLQTLGAGAPPAPAEPQHLRAVLVTGEEVWYLRRSKGDPDGEVSRRPLWWPPSKLAGRHLAPFLDREAVTEPSGGIERRFAGSPVVRRRAVILRGGAGRAEVRPLGHGRR